jgi:hypothetical protein
MATCLHATFKSRMQACGHFKTSTNLRYTRRKQLCGRAPGAGAASACERPL